MEIWAQLLMLACAIAISASQTCDDVVCCSGKVCVEETTGRSDTVRARCVTPTSCDQLDCPSGFVCVNETKGTRSTRTRASCQASCDNVQCPDFLQCVERGSYTECAVPSECSQVECPPGTSCQLEGKGKEMAAVCLGDSDSCDSIECFEGSECVLSTMLDSYDKSKSKTHRTKTGTTRTGTTRTGTGRTNGTRTGTGRTNGTRTGTGRTNGTRTGTGRTNGTRTGTSKTGTGRTNRTKTDTPAEDFAVCLPTCEGADICPQGLVCDIHHYQLICREPRSCDELECPAGQECEEVRCGKDGTRPYTKTPSRSSRMTKTPSGTKTGTKTGTYTKTRTNVLVRCVDIDDSGSGSGETPTFEVTTEMNTDPTEATEPTTDPPVLERVDNDQAALLSDSASSLVTTTAPIVLSTIAFYLLRA